MEGYWSSLIRASFEIVRHCCVNHLFWESAGSSFWVPGTVPRQCYFWHKAREGFGKFCLLLPGPTTRLSVVCVCCRLLPFQWWAIPFVHALQLRDSRIPFLYPGTRSTLTFFPCQQSTEAKLLQQQSGEIIVLQRTVKGIPTEHNSGC